MSTLTPSGGSLHARPCPVPPSAGRAPIADLFAFLTETNEARRAVERGDDLRELIMRPVDTDQIEAQIDDLEAEREVTGLVFTLAGYLVNSVHEEVPFMLLDSIESIDADRIARLVEYIVDFTDYLVVALLEEDAAALGTDHERIRSI